MKENTIINSGIRIIPLTVKDKTSGEKIEVGKAVYNILDLEVMQRFFEKTDTIYEIISKYEKEDKLLSEEESNDGTVAKVMALNLKFANELIDELDSVFGENFCKNSLGIVLKDMLSLENLIQLITNDINENSEHVKKLQKDKDTELKKYSNRSTRRASAKKK